MIINIHVALSPYGFGGVPGLKSLGLKDKREKVNMSICQYVNMSIGQYSIFHLKGSIVVPTYLQDA